MRLSRTIAGLVSAGLLGVTPLAMAGTAHAKDNLTSTTTATPSTGAVTYGDEISVSVDVVGSDGSSVYDGTQTLYALPAGSSTWTAVQTVDAGYSFYDVKPKLNSTYKVVYSGYTATTSYEDTVAASESAPFTVGVKRKVILRPQGLKLFGKVKPDYKRKKVVLKLKKGKKYVPWRKVKTNKKGAFVVKAPNRRGFKFQVIIKGNAKYIGDKSNWVVR